MHSLSDKSFPYICFLYGFSDNNWVKGGFVAFVFVCLKPADSFKIENAKNNIILICI